MDSRCTARTSPFKTAQTLVGIDHSDPFHRWARPSPHLSGNASEIIVHSEVLWLAIDPLECAKITNALGFSYEEEMVNESLKATGSLREWLPTKIKIHTGWDVLHLAISEALAVDCSVRIPNHDHFIDDLLDDIAKSIENLPIAAFCPESIDVRAMAETILSETFDCGDSGAVKRVMQRLPAMKDAWSKCCRELADYFGASLCRVRISSVSA